VDGPFGLMGASILRYLQVAVLLKQSLQIGSDILIKTTRKQLLKADRWKG